MAVNEEDRGQWARVDEYRGAVPPGTSIGTYVVFIHADYEQELRRVIDADEELRDRVNVMKGEIGRVDDRINFIDEFYELTEEQRRLLFKMTRDDIEHVDTRRAGGTAIQTKRGKRVAQWKLEQRGGRR